VPEAALTVMEMQIAITTSRKGTTDTTAAVA